VGNGQALCESGHGKPPRNFGEAQAPVSYFEVPPFLFGAVIKGLTNAGLKKTGRVVVEKPFGHDLASAGELAAEIHQAIDESQLSGEALAIADQRGMKRHLTCTDGGSSSSGCITRQHCFVREGVVGPGGR
jgi:Glucose-6-phosphate dehydrogenase, NAD binding domain